MAESCTETYPVAITRLGVKDTFGESARDEEIHLLLEKYGLTAKEITDAVLKSRSLERR